MMIEIVKLIWGLMLNGNISMVDSRDYSLLLFNWKLTFFITASNLEVGN